MSPLWLLAGPALAFVLGLLVGRWDRRIIGAVATLGSATALVVVAALAAQHPWQTPLVDDGSAGAWDVLPFATLVDGLAVTVAAMVCVVAFMVQIYSFGYLRHHERYGSYAAFVSLFTAAMLTVVIAGDLLFMVVGWEVMGLCSYLLIGQYWERSEARAAAMKSFLVTAFGDVGFILGVIVLATAAGSFLVVDVVDFGTSGDETLTSVGTMLLLLAVVGKSAQFPLQAWLPDAMAGPSPVSALIHAATMVAAGVYLVLRLFPLFLESGPTMVVLPVVSCLTMVGAAVAALAQHDLKRVLAWSTVSQLAMMLGAASVAGTEAATFSLVAHGFFKALLFLAAGSVIQAAGSTELAALGGTRRSLPWTTTTFGLGLLALAAVPPLSGFFSKESVLVVAQQAATGQSPVARWTGWLVLGSVLVTSAVTAAYCLRLWLLTCCGPPSAVRLGEAPWSMRAPLVLLSLPAVLFGLLGLRAIWFPTWSLPSATQVSVPAVLRPEPGATVLSLLAITLGAWVVWVRWRVAGEDPVPATTRWARAAASGFGMDVVYDRLAVRPFLALVRVVDRFDDTVAVGGVSQVGLGVQGLGAAVVRATPRNAQRGLTLAATGFVTVAVLVAVAAAVRAS